MRTRDDERLRERLEHLVATHDVAARRAADPVSFVHRYEDPADQEIVGLVASSLAFGNVVAIRRSVARALDVLGSRPASAVERTRRATLERRLEGFAHRVWKGHHLAALLANAGRLRRREGSLGASLARRLREQGELREALASFAGDLRGEGADRGLRHLMPDPSAGSACKRLLLYARWMIRPADGVDLGLWPVPTSALIIPVDTHIQRIARNLRLTTRNDASWRTAEEITAALRRFDPDDPVKYDFALCHLGVSRQCPSRRDPTNCGGCALRTVCRHWRAER